MAIDSGSWLPYQASVPMSDPSPALETSVGLLPSLPLHEPWMGATGQSVPPSCSMSLLKYSRA